MTKPSILDSRPEPSNHMLAGNKGFGIGIENLDETIAEYSDDQKELLVWWLVTAKDHGWNVSHLAKRTGVSTSTLSRVYRGVYGAGLDKVTSRLEAARESFVEVVENPDFIMTSLAKKMFAIFDKVRALRTIALIWGDKGIGKSTIEEEYARQHNHGQTYYFRTPGYGVTRNQFITELAAGMRIAVKGGAAGMREAIGKYLARGNRLLIIDEFHEIFRTCESKHIVQICEWLRQLYDQHNIGLAITGTELIKQEFFQGSYADILDQMVDRGTIQVGLPTKPTKKDIIAFLSHYHLKFPEPGTEEDQLLNDILKAHGLRKLTLHLRDGAVFAQKREDPYRWEHFNAAFKAIRDL